MSGYFCSLAIDTFSGPFRAVRVYIGPDKFSGHDLLRPVDAGMAKSMKGIENAASPVVGDEGTSHSVGHVNQQSRLANVNAAKIKS